MSENLSPVAITPKNITNVHGRSKTSTPNSGGIRKSLLTPCRRLGLGRNRKSGSKSSPLALNSRHSSPTVSSDTPLSTSLPVENAEIAAHSKVKRNIIPKQTDLEKAVSSVVNERTTETTNGIEEKTNLTVVVDKIAISSTLNNDNVSPDLEKEALHVKHESEKANPIVVIKKLAVNPDDDNITLKRTKEKARKALSLKLNDNNGDDNSSDDDFSVKRRRADVKDSPKSNVPKSERNKENKPKVRKQEKRKFVVIESSDEDDFVSSQNSGKSMILEKRVYKSSEEMLRMKIVEIRERIKKKTVERDSLLQNECYKRKHGLEELNSLINTWKGGCKSALKDLLAVLKEQNGAADMNDLLHSMNIPRDLISFNDKED